MGLKTALHTLLIFGIKQAYACLFGGWLLLVIVVSAFWYPFHGLYRYDFLFSQTTLNDARAQLIRARYDMRVSRAQIEALIGRDL